MLPLQWPVWSQANFALPPLRAAQALPQHPWPLRWQASVASPNGLPAVTRPAPREAWCCFNNGATLRAWYGVLGLNPDCFCSLTCDSLTRSNTDMMNVKNSICISPHPSWGWRAKACILQNLLNLHKPTLHKHTLWLHLVSHFYYCPSPPSPNQPSPCSRHTEREL